MCLEELYSRTNTFSLAIDVSDQRFLGKGKCLHGSFLAFAFHVWSLKF
jgi:hypothetical protein